jgi:TetR/AcrR family transcriptional repressor of nem operon
MAGVKQFDREIVLDRAMALFWQRGYEATSIHDLVEATGINRGSIYGTFGDKQGFFLAVLDHYWEKIGTPMIAELSNPDPRQAVECMLKSIVRRTSDPRFPRGCLATNTSLECPATGDEIARRIAAGFGQQESAVYHVLHQAQVAVVLDPHVDIRAMARFFLALANGMNVINKALPDPEILRDILRVAMTVWDATSCAPKSKRRPRAGKSASLQSEA